MAENTSRNDAVLQVGVRLDTNSLYNQVASAAAKIPPLKLRTQGNLSLGTFSKQANDFRDSLDAANKRVTAFAATASVLYATSRAFNILVSSTVEVEKALTDLNVVFSVSKNSLKQLSDEMFNAANKTGQSWSVASEALLEFGRQGLSVQESIKRTTAALELTRFTGLEVAKSVSTITTALNSFDDAGLDAIKILDKISSVDLSFAVGGKDLAEGLSRVSSIAKDAGISIDKLFGLVTAGKQLTGRTGEVVSTSIGTIIQRIGRSDSLSKLRDIGVVVDEVNGEFLSTDKILQNLAQTFNKLSQSQQNQIVQIVGGVRNANTLRALMSDLSKENSIFAQATRTSAEASGFAASRNEELNKTLAAQLNLLTNQITQASSKFGELTIKPVIQKITGIPGFLDRLTSSFGEDAQQGGLRIGEGILVGLSNFLSGPGLLTASVLAGKLFGQFAGFAAKSFGNILETTTKEFGARQAIQGLLAQQPGLMAQINRGALSQVEIQQAILNSLRAQSLEMARQGQIVSAAKHLVGSGAVSVSGGGLTLGKSGIELKGATLNTKTSSYPRFGKDLDYKVPNFAITGSRVTNGNVELLNLLQKGFNRSAGKGIGKDIGGDVYFETNKNNIDNILQTYANKPLDKGKKIGYILNTNSSNLSFPTDNPGLPKSSSFRVSKGGVSSDQIESIQKLLSGGKAFSSGDIDFVNDPKIGKEIDFKKFKEKYLGIFGKKLPNFANPLSSAILREAQAGVPKSLIRVGQSPSLKSSINPAGLGVYNLRDEPQGLNQGIQRVLSQGKNPKLNGIPNFAPVYTQNIRETIKDPFNRSPGTTLLNPQLTQQLENEISKLKNQIKLGTRDFDSLNRASDDLAKSYNLTAESAKKINQRLQSSLRIVGNRNKPSQSSLSGLTGDLFGGQFVATGSGRQGEFLGITQQAELANLRKQEKFNRQTFTENFLLNRNARALTTKPDLSSLQSIGLYSSVTRKETTEQLSARLASERLQKLESRAGIFTKDGRQAASDLKKADPDRFRGFQQSLQNKAFLASIVGPILGGIGQEAANGIFGDNKTGRGIGQSAAGLGNAAGFAATGFVLGGPGGAVAGGIFGLLLELPKVFKAFSDTLPDLQKRFEELKDVSQQTSAAFANYIDTSEKLADVFSGKVTGLSNRQVDELKQGQRNSLLSIGNLDDRNRIGDLVKNNQLNQAREEINIINQRNAQAAGAAGLLSNVKTILPNIKPENDIRAESSRLSEKGKEKVRRFGANRAQLSLSDLELDTEKFNKKINDPKRQKQIENLISPTEQFGLGLIDKEGKSLFDNLLKSPELSKQLTGAKSGEFGKVFLDLATSLNGFDNESIIKLAQSFTELEKQLGPEFRNRVNKTFSVEGLKNLELAGKTFEANGIKSAQAIFELNKTLFESQKRFQELGTSIEISGIQKLGQLTTNLRKNEINQSSSNRIDLLSRNGDNLSNLFNFTETLSANRNQTTLQREQLSNKTGGNIFDVLDNLKNTGIQRIRADSVDEGGIKSLEDVKNDISKFNQTFNQAFQPFIDRLNNGEQVTSDFLRSLEDTTKSQLQNLDRNRTNNDKSQTESIKALNDFSQAIFKLSKDFKVAGEQITSDSKGAGEIALENFRNKQREINESRRIRQDVSGATSGIDLGVISRQAQLLKQQLGANPEQLIRLKQQSDLIGFGGDRLNKAIGDRPELGKLGLTPENLGGELQRLISEGQQTIGNLEKIVRLGGGEQAVKDLNIANDRTNALIDLQNEYNKEKAKLNALSKEEIENLKTQLAFSSDILNVQRRINEENSRKGDFKAVRENLGETFTKSLSFNSNDFYNELSKNTADFGEEFKQTFKDGFAEAATGAKSFEDALTNIGLSLGKNILTKASNLATDQLFGSLFGNQSNLTGGAGILSGLFSGKKYAKGGYVNQGSGTKDDVPALLSGGEFVVKKSSTQKLGKNFLNALNNGGLIRGYASGGLSTKQLSKLPPQKQQDIINAISAQGLDASFANEYFGEKSKSRPTKGAFNTSSLLSDIALTDENNPQNKLKFDRERYFIDLKAYERQKRKALNQFNKAQTARRTSAYISAAINFAGSSFGGPNAKPVTTSNPTTNVGRLGGFDFNGIQSYSANYVANGGLIKKYDRGGSVFGGDDIRDNIPAYLMGGEFVVNKNSVNRIGKSNLEYMNKTGRVPGFANGGYVGDSNSTSYGMNNDIASKYFSELISISAQIRDNINNSNKTGGSGEINISNTITVNISDSGIKTNSSSQVNNKEDSNSKDKNNQDKQNQGKQLGQVVTQIVNAALVKESKNGGLLESVFKKK